MIRFLFGMAFLLSASLYSFGQCDQCPAEETFAPDYCFITELLPGKCAQFSLKADHFFFHPKAGKAGKRLTLPQQLDLAYWISLTQNKSLKLKSADVLFLQEALQQWQSKALELKIDQAGSKRYTGEELTSFEYEARESGLGVHLLEQGSGPLAKKGEPVKVHYRGYLENGNVFDASYDRGTPFEFPLGVGRVIKGWDEGIGLYPVGSHLILQIPPDLGYGGREVGTIPANSTLYFDVLILESQ